MFKEVNVFDSKKDGYGTTRIPGIIVTSKGTLLAYCEARENGSDWAPMDILLKRSVDNGEHWSQPIIIVKGMDNNTTYNNPVMIMDEDKKTIHMVYCKEYEQVYYIKSLDEGKSWTEPKEITSTFNEYKEEYDWKVVATGPGHGIQLSDGRLLIPIWMSTDKSHHPSVISIIYSEDKGQSWRRGDIVWETKDILNPNETTAVELEDGSVLLNIRNTSSKRRRALSISRNGINNWSVPKLHNELIDSMCFGSMIKLKNYDNKLLLSNIHHNELRKNLTISMSGDSGRTWPIIKSIYRGEAAYSDLATSNHNKEIYCLYEKDGYRKIILAKFNFEWISQ